MFELSRGARVVDDHVTSFLPRYIERRRVGELKPLVCSATCSSVYTDHTASGLVQPPTSEVHRLTPIGAWKVRGRRFIDGRLSFNGRRWCLRCNRLRRSLLRRRLSLRLRLRLRLARSLRDDRFLLLLIRASLLLLRTLRLDSRGLLCSTCCSRWLLVDV